MNSRDVAERLRDTIEKSLREYRCQYAVDVDDGDPLPLVDALCFDGETIARGNDEIFMLADHLAAALQVAPMGQRDGIANELWSHLMAWCRKRGVPAANYNDLFAIVSEIRKGPSP